MPVLSISASTRRSMGMRLAASVAANLELGL
jgi:hypothetical protein